MRVLMLSPFSPHGTHYHAAADTLVRLTPRLAEHTDLFVYSPEEDVAAAARRPDLNYTMLTSTLFPRPRVWDRVGPKPAWLRQVWPREATREVVELIERIRPEVIHAEYLQSGEVLGGRRHTVLGLHDITERVMRESYRASSGMQRPYRWAELTRTRRFERGTIRAAGAVITLSDHDFTVASRLNPRTVLARPGVDLGDVSWSPPPNGQRLRLVYAGAMWRRANVLAAEYLIRSVMPLVWQTFPAAELRIVGAQPPAELIRMGEQDVRVVVTGAVPDLRDEMLDAHAVVVPSIVGGGVLMKVAHAMALGCPVITSPGPAESVRGDETMLFIAATPTEVAAAVRLAVAMPDEGVRRGLHARAHIERMFRWDATVRGYLDAYEMARRQ